jgi:integrase
MPAKRVFTETWIKNLKARARRVDYTEAGRKGLMLRLSPGGERTFVVRYQIAGATRVMRLGNWPATTLEAAHEQHLAARKLIQAGIDPIEHAEAAKHDHELAVRRAKHKAGSVGDVFEEWMRRAIEKNRKRPEQVRRAIEADVLPRWRTRRAADIAKRDVVLLLDAVVDRGSPIMANRLYNLLAQMFKFAVARDLIESSPCVGIDRPGGDEKPRERKLGDVEIRAFWHGVSSEGAKVSPIVALGLKLILTTAQRPGEVAGAMRTELDTGNAVWTIPAHRSKNAREHEVPLSELALELLDEIAAVTAPKRGEARRPALLPNPHRKLKAGAPISTRALSRALQNSTDKKGKLFGCEPFTPHDLRRTAASMMTALGIPRLHVAKVLNHTDQDITGAVYDQHDYAEEKKQALDVWAAELRAIISGTKRQVVPITRRARHLRAGK